MSITELTALAAQCSDQTRLDAPAASDAALLDSQRQLAAIARLIDLASAAVAAEIAHRSRRELGYDGLAARLGARTPEALVQTITGTSAPTARRLVQVGTLVAAPAHPWLQPAIDAVATGALSAEALEVIAAALGSPTLAVPASALLATAASLAALDLPLERLAARAREARDELDAAGVAEREEQRRDRRFLKLTPLPDGMTRLSGLLDPESAAVVGSAIDAATSPRRGGPRFLDSGTALVNDPRTTEQIALDSLVELVDIAVRTDALPGRRPDVRVLVTQQDLDRRSGVGYIDGQTAAVSIATVERHACDGGLIPILFDDDGQALNLGRSQRLHSARQRTAIAARDGGCLAPDCGRSASWCEVHHIHEFGKGGSTDLADGVLLCRHHHMLVHNNGWRVDRRDGRYWFVPPPDIDSGQAPILLETKSAAMRRMLRAS